MRKYRLLDIDLSLFDGAAGGDGGGAAGTAGGGAEGAAQAAESALPKAESKGRGHSRRGKAGAYDNVVFGRQDAAGADPTGPVAGGEGEGNAKTQYESPEARRQAFEDLIRGEFKDLYDEQVRSAINRRFKGAKGMEDSLSAQKPIMDLLMQRYKVDDGDPGKLLQALEQDDTYWAAAAEEAGMDTAQYKEFQRMARQNAEFQRRERVRLADEQAQKQLARWHSEAQTLKTLYPSFDFEAESQNQHFRELLKAGLSVQESYQLIHMDELTQAAARSAAQAMEQQVTARVKARAARPAENGTSPQSAAIVRDDVNSLSSADVLEVARRVHRNPGKKISFS